MTANSPTASVGSIAADTIGCAEGAPTSATQQPRGMRAFVRGFLKQEDGATAIEYSLIVGLIFLTCVAAIRSYTASASSVYSEIENAVVNTNP